MIWIPILFVCFESCVFVYGHPEYSEQSCLNALTIAIEKAESEAQGVAGVCIPVIPV